MYTYGDAASPGPDFLSCAHADTGPEAPPEADGRHAPGPTMGGEGIQGAVGSAVAPEQWGTEHGCAGGVEDEEVQFFLADGAMQYRSAMEFRSQERVEIGGFEIGEQVLTDDTGDVEHAADGRPPLAVPLTKQRGDG